MKIAFLKKLLFSFFVLLCLYSCEQGVVYEQNLSIKNGEWDRANKAVFAFNVEDTLSKYALFLNLRHAGNYPFKNLYLFTKTTTPKGKIKVDTAQMIFADSKGKWMGKGIGDIYDYQFKFKNNIAFRDSGEYKIEIEQAMRERVLPGVTDIGIQIEKVKK